MAELTVRTCDKCGTLEGVVDYAVSREGQVFNLDLCGEHQVPLEELLTFGTSKVPRKRRARRSAGANVTTMEEIEALKKK